MLSQQNDGAWQECLNLLKARVQLQSYNTWFKSTRLVSDGDGQLVVGVANRFVASWLEKNYYGDISEAVASTFGAKKAIKFVVSPDVQEVEVPRLLPPEDKPAPSPIENSLCPKFIFDNFVVGDSNQFARAAAMAVAEAPAGNRFNPLYIYGGVGLGKTHLAQAIGNFAYQARKSVSVLYVTSEKFTNDFINAIASQKTADFLNYYRGVDLLLIDDIQFLTGKEATQVQFFHTFNALHQSGRQIVLTSDRPPQEIYGLEERLLSRFQSGLVVDIQPPDFEMRIAIIKQRIEAEQLPISDEVVAYIAEKVRSNIRELEGFLIRVSAHAYFHGQQITIELVAGLLARHNTRKQRELSLEDIRDAVAGFFSLSPENLIGKGKTVEVANARQIAMFIARLHTTYSLKTIGRFFGGRDHSTVIHSVNKIKDDIAHDSRMKFRIDEIIKKAQSAVGSASA